MKNIANSLLNAFVCVTLMCVSGIVCSADINQDNSRVEFAGKHAGMEFIGTFKKWHGTVDLPLTEQSKIVVEFDLRHAKTGNFTYDSTLPQADWFNVKDHPTAKFVSSSITKIGDGFEVKGMLTLRGKTVPETFTFYNFKGKWLTEFIIFRLVYDIGGESDPQAEWVSSDIQMLIEIPLK